MRLDGVTVLLVEDEALVAMDLQDTFEDHGAQVIGPAVSLSEAMTLAQDGTVDVALLDIDLRGKDVFPAAEILEAREIPFAFHTGHGTRAELTMRFPSAPVCKKPASSSDIIRTLACLVRGGKQN